MAIMHCLQMLVVALLSSRAAGAPGGLRTGSASDRPGTLSVPVTVLQSKAVPATAPQSSFASGQAIPDEGAAPKGQASAQAGPEVSYTMGNGQIASRVVLQLLFGLVYYFMIVKNYPKLHETTGNATPEAAKKLQSENPVFATLQSGISTCLCSFCCSGPRAAHTFSVTGVLDYWVSLVLMSLFPCCTLWLVNSQTDLNEKLGGEKQGCCMGCLCAMFCSCCLIAQDAESLDLVVGVKTGLCGVSGTRDQ